MANPAADIVLVLALVWLAANAAILVACWRDLARTWREPVFIRPVLVVDSDDWGAGPLPQAAALREIAGVLARHHDAAGRPPVLNLALVLAVPDGPAVAASGEYRRVCLDDDRFADVLAALRDGARQGVFALQLHGLEHYWPATLIASGDAAVQRWLRQPVPATTEQLPSPLQSRWVDSGRLPSSPHPAPEVDAAVAEEVEAYERIVGVPPKVVVPPTFVWTRDVERAWAARGVECIVTPGRRAACRDAAGRPGCYEGPIANGDRAPGLTYVVRNDYFEPVRGRDTAHAVRALDRCVREGRPCVLENHRDNFVGDSRTCRASLIELDTLCREALQRYRDLRFLSTHELCRILRDRDPRWITSSSADRLPAWRARLATTGRPWTLLRLSGAAALLSLLVTLFGHRSAGAPTA
jgi:hypothetical protein